MSNVTLKVWTLKTLVEACRVKAQQCSDLSWHVPDLTVFEDIQNNLQEVSELIADSLEILRLHEHEESGYTVSDLLDLEYKTHLKNLL